MFLHESHQQILTLHNRVVEIVGKLSRWETDLKMLKIYPYFIHRSVTETRQTRKCLQEAQVMKQ